MTNVLLGMSLLFVALAFIVTESNAKYLLAGYNTMSAEEQTNVDIKAYISYFKKFHIFLGLSLFLFGMLLPYFANENVAGIFLAVYPISAYLYFIITSAKYFKTTGNTKKNKIGILIIAVVLIVIVLNLSSELKETKLVINTNTIEFKGSYGEVLPFSEIKSIQMVADIPKIKMKTNGFGLGSIRKGYFKTEDNEVVKLILNGDNKPYILFTKSNTQKIYYGRKEASNQRLFDSINTIFIKIISKK